MWIFIWVVLSAILIGASLWSLRILLTQKDAWDKYAKSKNLTFKRGTFMGPAEMSGVIDAYKISFFTAERSSADIRAKRYVTVIEISLGEGLFDGGAMGTKEMLPFMQSLDRLHPYKIEGNGWEDGLFAFVKHDLPAQTYLTADRVETIANLLKTKNADVILVFNHQELVLRLETSDPMQSADKIDKIVKRLLGLTDKLRIPAEERAALKAMAPAESE